MGREQIRVTVYREAAETLELSKALVTDIKTMLDKAQLLINGWKARDFLDKHRENPCIQCVSAGIASATFGVHVDVASRMLCYDVRVAASHVQGARQAMGWFES